MPRKPGHMKDNELVSMADLNEVILELSGVRVTKETARRWTITGKKNYLGKYRKIRTTKRAMRDYTCREWILDFIKAV